tara:strand:+ start:85 stop:579 length:495 start_codon:yes stop_codon:yes gene_type:complete
MKVAEILIIIVAFLIGYFLSHITGGLVEGQENPGALDCFPTIMTPEGPTQPYTREQCCNPQTRLRDQGCWDGDYTYENCCNGQSDDLQSTIVNQEAIDNQETILQQETILENNDWAFTRQGEKGNEWDHKNTLCHSTDSRYPDRDSDTVCKIFANNYIIGKYYS